MFSVDYDDGSSRQFVVVGLRQYSKIEAPLEELFGRSGPPRLVLITCVGTFIEFGAAEDTSTAS